MGLAHVIDSFEEVIMLDINKLLAAEAMAPCDADAFLSDLPEWNENLARDQAWSEGLDLSAERLEALCWLREHHAACGPAPNARSLLRAMEEAFQREGGRRYLYELFPRGPISQGSRLAGLPTPPGNADPSFGTSH
jgi:tRNA 2-thiouridine synthesizing protein E